MRPWRLPSNWAESRTERRSTAGRAVAYVVSHVATPRPARPAPGSSFGVGGGQFNKGAGQIDAAMIIVLDWSQ